MALSLEDLKSHCNVTGHDDDPVLYRLMEAARRRVEGLLGYTLDDEDALPGGAPADLEHAVYMLAAHWYENREASLVGVSAQALPFGIREILADYRRYTFGAVGE